MRSTSRGSRRVWRSWLIVSMFTVPFTLIAGVAPALAEGQQKGYETGPLDCGSTTYNVYATGFGSAFRVVETTGVLVFRSGTLTNRDTGTAVTFGQNGLKEGVVQMRCTGVLVNPLYGSSFDVVFYMSAVP
jgi:hypothetical protein